MKIRLYYICVLVTLLPNSKLLGTKLYNKDTRTEYLSVRFGGGIGSFFNIGNTGKNTLLPGGMVQISYQHFFNNTFGMSIGVETGFLQGRYSFHSTDYYQNIIQSYFNSNCDLEIKYSDIHEKQWALMTSIPLQLLIRFNLYKKHIIIIGVGGSLCYLPFGYYQWNRGTISTSAYFPSIGLSISNIAEYNLTSHSFTEPNLKNEGELNFRLLNANAIIDVGYQWYFKKDLALYVGLYATCGITNIMKNNNVLYDWTKNLYSGLTNSTSISASRPLELGFKLGIDVDLASHAHVKKYGQCKCVR